MSVSISFDNLLQTLSIAESYACGALKVASFLHKIEDQSDTSEFLKPILNELNFSDKRVEYLLFCLLNVEKSDILTFSRALNLRRLRQLLSRQFSRKPQYSENECTILSNLSEKLKVSTLGDLQIAINISKKWSAKLLNGEEIGDLSRQQLSLLLKSEAIALKERISDISARVDCYNMKAIARLLPLLTISDEAVKSTEDLALSVLEKRSIGYPVLSLETVMKTDSLNKLIKKMSQSKSMASLVKLIDLQRNKLIPITSLVAVSTLCRWIHSNIKSPVQWITQALDCSINGEFTLDSGDELSKIKPLLVNTGIVIDGTLLRGNFRKTTFSHLINIDMLTKPCQKEPDMSIKDLVSCAMKNDLILCRLLDNPKVYGTPGLVARITQNSRSLFVLHKIASTRELYCGQANVTVPITLLKHPSTIPISTLRMFINPRFVSLMEMREFMRNPYGVRREIYSEVKSFMERKR
jgi:hypothetical protein